MRVTIVLETGAFFPQNPKQTFVDVGYFETLSQSDIAVTEDGRAVLTSQASKFGKGNTRIEVEHLEKDRITVKTPVTLSKSYNDDILKKYDLYDRNELPAFIENEYDCIFRFHSGVFKSADVRPRRFTAHRLSDDQPTTGKDKSTRAIANEIHVEYDVAAGETLRLRANGQKEVWSTDNVSPGTNSVVVTILADDQLNPAYHKRALNHQAQHYYLPNSDPPPMDGP
ncbi:MAG TPA: hypothetical protein VFF31_13290 [Blastocatellia bacterium]|nr:hypothetical protein [Blastocatellia bacterium]